MNTHTHTHTHTVSLLFGFQPAPARNARADVQQFISEFESEYGTTHPSFLQCSYSEVGREGGWREGGGRKGQREEREDGGREGRMEGEREREGE